MRPDDFTFGMYSRFLRLAKSRGATFLRACDVFPIDTTQRYRQDEPVISIRHDVDNDIGKAIRMARIEASEGVRSTYFVRMAPEFKGILRMAMRYGSAYNLCAMRDCLAVREIRSYGHEIGLHYEWTQFAQYGVDACDLVRAQASMLRALIGEKSIGAAAHGSPHARATGTRNTAIWQYMSIPAADCGLAYFFYQGLHQLTETGIPWIYCSDTGGSWNGLSILDDEFLDYAGLRIALVHPDWWSGKRVNAERLGRLTRHALVRATRRMLPDTLQRRNTSTVKGPNSDAAQEDSHASHE